ncbi:cryptochrome DASH, mitochondrial [Phlyctema vagabunda]|uniref:Cryptochrome DASH n=1 Tax=Phlyctema vagabunda TaxID=108571 RepID=A0ABR4PPY8_9HELO
MLRQFTPLLKSVSRRSSFSTSATRMSPSTLVYLLRRDLRVADNPILHAIEDKQTSFSHVLPIYVFAAQQLEVSGFIPDGGKKSPYPEARSEVGGFWRCGPRRAQFLAEAVFDLKAQLEDTGSGLCIRVGMVGEVIKQLLENEDLHVSAVWMTEEEGVEEKREEKDVKRVCEQNGAQFKLWNDAKYLIDDKDVPFDKPSDLPDVFTTYRKMVEPLREAPRAVLPAPSKLPAFPTSIPAQHAPFKIPADYESVLKCLQSPLNEKEILRDPPAPVPSTESAHPFKGGETEAQKRLSHLLSSGAMTHYKETRNGLLGTDFSTKLSAWLALGSITARQVHSSMAAFEDGKAEEFRDAPGYGQGENDGTKAVRFELLWRDYMRLCTRKFGPRLFRIQGFNGGEAPSNRWLETSSPKTQKLIARFLNGTTGMGFIDASQRELYHTGYTSNRARQNVASFLSKMLNVDWRVGAEWYESMLVDYDLSSNWGNWQYVAGVGNDPRGAHGRVFNPVKQAFDYDLNADYVRAWLPELRELQNPGECFQAWTVPEPKRHELGLAGDMVEDPLKKIEFTVGRRGGKRGGGGGGPGLSHDNGRGGNANRGRYRGHSEKTGGEKGMGPGSKPGGYGGRGYGSTRGYHTNGNARGGNYGRGGGGGGGGGRGREGRMGMMEKDRLAGEENARA